MDTIVNVSGTTSTKKWTFEIFHSKFVDGIRQTCIDGAGEKIDCIGRVQAIQHLLYHNL